MAWIDFGAFAQSARPLFPDGWAVVQTLGLGAVCAAFLTPAEMLAPAQRQPLWNRKGVALDVMYWFVTPLLTRAATGAVMAGVVLVFMLAMSLLDHTGTLRAIGLHGSDGLPVERLIHGFGPLGRLPVWAQCVGIMLVTDLADYWTHRSLHRGRWWRIHAIHHSPEEMNWISSARVHPLNDLITRSCQILPVILLGFAATSVMSVIPLVSLYVMFLHSNVRWDFGPFRWVLVSPAYHRWHHTSDAEGIDKNFAGFFPMWDLLFGTAYFPKGRLPKKYGLAGYQLPEHLGQHLLYPFRGRALVPTHNEDGRTHESSMSLLPPDALTASPAVHTSRHLA